MSWHSLKKSLHSTTAKLALSYLAIMMVLSIAFSIILYNVSEHELERQVPPPNIFLDRGFNPHPGYKRFFNTRINEGRHELIGRLIALNVVVLGGGGLMSYYLARRTLEPIENAMAAQARFVTDASHELRTPLTTILASNEVALRSRKLSLPAAKELITSNVEEVTRLQALSNNLLNLATLDNALPTLKPVKLQDVATEALNQVIKTAQSKKVSIEDTVPSLSIKGDDIGLIQATVVLLDNAIKYSPASSTITLDGYKKGKKGYLRVTDEGNGIDPDDLPHIFERFYRADSSRTKSADHGYGIGLSIAKHLIEQQNGRIIAMSSPGNGSTFEIELPLA